MHNCIGTTLGNIYKQGFHYRNKMITVSEITFMDCIAVGVIITAFTRHCYPIIKPIKFKYVSAILSASCSYICIQFTLHIRIYNIIF